MKILVIEDTEKHMADAKAFFAGQEGVNVEYKYSTPHPRDLHPGTYDVVLCDIYFGEEPKGVAVMMICREQNIPCIMVTAGFHHGARYDWICQLGRALHCPEMVDSRPKDKEYGEADSKDWRRAYLALQWVLKEGLCETHGKYHVGCDL